MCWNSSRSPLGKPRNLGNPPRKSNYCTFWGDVPWRHDTNLFDQSKHLSKAWTRRDQSATKAPPSVPHRLLVPAYRRSWAGRKDVLTCDMLSCFWNVAIWICVGRLVFWGHDLVPVSSFPPFEADPDRREAGHCPSHPWMNQSSILGIFESTEVSTPATGSGGLMRSACRVMYEDGQGRWREKRLVLLCQCLGSKKKSVKIIQRQIKKTEWNKI